MRFAVVLPLLALTASCAMQAGSNPDADTRWLAGDHHVHSHYSVTYDEDNPPAWSIGGDGIYPIPMNALMARYYGLEWVVATDHGGPNHSKINFEHAYPELQLSRDALPDVVQFFGLELNTPAADHSSVIVPHTHDEAAILRQIESRFDKYEPLSRQEIKARNHENRMLDALEFMDGLTDKPVVIANHPARTAAEAGGHGLTSPRELRNWNDEAPDVAVGMEGAPGHQAGPLSINAAPRGWYFDYPTMGGYDQMTARLGGAWDALLGEGRRWWITANSDSHRNYREGGVAFWPGQYAKTYVFASKNHTSILEGLRRGRVFVTTGDLVSELYVTVSDAGSSAAEAEIGGTLIVAGPSAIEVCIRLRDPETPNHHGDNPGVARVDLIAGDISGLAADRTLGANASTAVIRRFTEGQWQREGEYLIMSHRLSVQSSLYLRVRGTNTAELEPAIDAPDEGPWHDLWFYSNPVFVELSK